DRRTCDCGGPLAFGVRGTLRQGNRRAAHALFNASTLGQGVRYAAGIIRIHRSHCRRCGLQLGSLFYSSIQKGIRGAAGHLASRGSRNQASKMKILINIDVPELAPAIDFYCAALSLSLARILDEDTAELKGGSSTLYLLRKDAGSRPVEGLADERRYARHWTPVHMDFVVDDVDQ